MSLRANAISLSGALLLAGCQASLPPLETVEQVDLERFMGDWYVIANIPTFVEKGAHNAVESYRLDDDGTIATTFTFRKDGFRRPGEGIPPPGFRARHAVQCRVGHAVHLADQGAITASSTWTTITRSPSSAATSVTMSG